MLHDYPMLLDELEKYLIEWYEVSDPFGSFEDARDSIEKLMNDLNDYDDALEVFGQTLKEDTSIPRGMLAESCMDTEIQAARDVLTVAEAAIELVRNVDIGHPLDMTELRRAVRDVALVRFE